MYEGIKKALGPTSSKSAPLKAKSGILLTNKAQQMERWVEHYSELYSRHNVLSPSALDATVNLPPLDDLDAEAIMVELRHAIKQLKPGKAPGNGSIPPDLLKYCLSTLAAPVHHMITKYWQEGCVP